MFWQKSYRIIPHNMTSFKFICVLYQFHRKTLPIMKIDRHQIQFREYVSTGTELQDFRGGNPTLGLVFRGGNNPTLRPDFRDEGVTLG